MICKVCERNRRHAAFQGYIHRNGKEYFSRTCRECVSKRLKKQYAADPEKFKSKSRERWRTKSGYYLRDRRDSVKERRDFIQKVKSETACKDCDKRFHPVAMDFDHRGDKTAGVAYMAQHGYSLERIKAEIAKCDVVCANCHRIRTWVAHSTGHLKEKT